MCHLQHWHWCSFCCLQLPEGKKDRWGDGKLMKREKRTILLISQIPLCQSLSGTVDGQSLVFYTFLFMEDSFLKYFKKEIRIEWKCFSMQYLMDCRSLWRMHQKVLKLERRHWYYIKLTKLWLPLLLTMSIITANLSRRRFNYLLKAG